MNTCCISKISVLCESKQLLQERAREKNTCFVNLCKLVLFVNLFFKIKPKPKNEITTRSASISVSTIKIAQLANSFVFSHSDFALNWKMDKTTKIFVVVDRLSIRQFLPEKIDCYRSSA